jgi:hypothetical protein
MKAVYWGLDPTVSDEDFRLWAANDVLVMIRERAKPDDIVYEKNQARNPRYYYTCTITSAILSICDLWNEDLTDKELDDVCEEAISKGLDPKEWWSFYEAVNCARNYWNRTRPTKKVVSFRTDYGTKEYFTALSFGYTLVCWYKGNAAYNADKDADGVLEGTTFPNWTYGHCIRKMQNSGIIVIDNYSGVHKYNRYTLENPDDLQKNGVFYKDHYVFLRDADLTQSEKDRLQGKTLGIWNGERENAQATRRETAIMVARGAKLVPNDGTEASKAVELGIWNGENWALTATRLETQEMIKRAFKVDMSVMYPNNAITRWEVVELLVREINRK